MSSATASSMLPGRYGRIVSEIELLLDVKFSVPQLRPGTVGCGGLVETARSSSCRVVAITASAGCGMSAFVSPRSIGQPNSVAGQFDFWNGGRRP
jgi:hypothetical protein